MDPKELYKDRYKEVQELFDSAITEIDTTFDKYKVDYENSLGNLKDILENLPLRKITLLQTTF